MKGYTNIGLLLSVVLLASCANGLNASAVDNEGVNNAMKRSQQVDLFKKGAYIAAGITAGAAGGYYLLNDKAAMQLQNVDLGLHVASLTEQIAELTAKNEKLAAELASKSSWRCSIL